jgi:hypothetical protein
LKYPKILADSTHRGNKFVILSKNDSILFSLFGSGAFDSSLRISTLVVISKLPFLDLDDEIELKFFDIILLHLYIFCVDNADTGILDVLNETIRVHDKIIATHITLIGRIILDIINWN